VNNYDTTQLAVVLESWMIDKLRTMVNDRQRAAEQALIRHEHGSDDVIELHEMNEIMAALSSPEYVA